MGGLATDGSQELFDYPEVSTGMPGLGVGVAEVEHLLLAGAEIGDADGMLVTDNFAAGEGYLGGAVVVEGEDVHGQGDDGLVFQLHE